MRKKLLMYAMAGLLAAGVGAVVSPVAAQAHGAMMVPGSRTWLCYKDGRNPNTGAIEPKNAACAAAVAKNGPNALYNWFAVLRSDGAGRMDGFIPNGELCSGGTGGPYDFSGFNLARNDWPVTHLTAGRQIGIQYNNWAKHPGTFRLYITKDSWSPTRALAWSDLESTPFDTVTNPPDQGGPGSDDGHYYWNATLPSNKSGRHLIYSVWQRSDSNETFYGCSDVTFDGGNGEVTGVGGGTTTPPPTTPPPTTPPPTTPPPTTPPPTTPPPGNSNCYAMFNIASAWNGGFQAEVMVHADTAAINNWTVSWTWPGSQTLTQAWNGTATSSGSLVSVKNVSYNGTVGAGKYVTFGLLGNGTAPPSVNNLACSTT
ncbi:lytic polysaccharide monooxygenase auxiliary activity family 9 protein [Paractinoplanes lichenicola]|uniref:Lytic polysaccharide monooxygenase n=1 Tax=Paractinoplanes lichenicola TaxID=2802976 RepID=A0ABS1VX98_9ACTN|nr:lytic polysaccharide monooxygenase [Actinoplanes lichenicola]MBL7258963.1 lytic polysaccharide monooxygenase [Actinoplanes lichenicola]